MCIRNAYYNLHVWDSLGLMADKSYMEFLLGESWAMRAMVKKANQMHFPTGVL